MSMKRIGARTPRTCAFWKQTRTSSRRPVLMSALPLTLQALPSAGLYTSARSIHASASRYRPASKRRQLSSQRRSGSVGPRPSSFTQSSILSLMPPPSRIPHARDRWGHGRWKFGWRLRPGRWSTRTYGNGRVTGIGDPRRRIVSRISRGGGSTDRLLLPRGPPWQDAGTTVSLTDSHEDSRCLAGRLRLPPVIAFFTPPPVANE